MSSTSNSTAPGGTDDAPKWPTAPPNSNFARAFETLPKAGSEPEGSTNKGFLCTCPVPEHADRNASLEVNFGDLKGKPMFSCPPCEGRLGSHEAFMDALYAAGVRWNGDPVMEMDDITWGEPAHRPAKPGSGGGGKGLPLGETHRLDDVYAYKHADATDNFKVRRYVPRPAHADMRKKFFPMRWDTDLHRWISKRIDGRGPLDGVERTPYWYERFEEWATPEEGSDDLPAIYLVEGEKAANALVKHKRSPKAATTFHGGCKKEPEHGWVERYGFGRFNVRVWPDADEVGVAWARRRAEELRAAGVNVEFWGVAAEHVEPEDDAFDVLARRHGRKIKRLSDEEVDALAALKAASKEEKKQQFSVVSVNGKTLIPATGYEPAQGTEDEGDGPSEPYSTVATVDPQNFADEYLYRHYTDPEGVLTLRHVDNMFWLWQDTRYESLTDKEVRARLVRDLEGACETTLDGEVRPLRVKKTTKGELIDALTDRTLVSKHGAGVLLPATGGIPFRNGWLDLKTEELRPHSPIRNSRWTVPIDFAKGGAKGDEVWAAFTRTDRYGYDPDDAEATEKAWIKFLDRPKVREHVKFAGAPFEWMRFLATIGYLPGTDEYRLLRQWYGYLLSGSKAQEKALLLLGPQRAGKGTVIHVAEAFFGMLPEVDVLNTSCGAAATNLDSIGTRFGLSDLLDKGLITMPDVRFPKGDRSSQKATLLSLTSKDNVRVEAKYKDPFSINLPGRLMLATNELPDFFAESSDALPGRFLPLVFKRSFADNPDIELLDRLLAELDAIVRWSLVGLADLTEQGKFTLSDEGLSARVRMAENSEPIRVFATEECEFVPADAEHGFVAVEDVFGAWDMYARRNGFPSYDSNNFSRRLQDAYPDKVKPGREYVGRKQVRVLYGIRPSTVTVRYKKGKR